MWEPKGMAEFPLAGLPKRLSEAWPRGAGDPQVLGKRWDHSRVLDGAGQGLVKSAAPLGSAVPVVWAGFPEWPAT